MTFTADFIGLLFVETLHKRVRDHQVDNTIMLWTLLSVSSSNMVIIIIVEHL